MKKREQRDKSTAHSKYRCRYHIVYVPQYRRKEIYGTLRKDIGKNKKVIAEYIRNQSGEDRAAGQTSIKEYTDPFTGNKNK